MLSGFFFAFAVLRYGVTRFREELINGADSDMRIGRWWDWAIKLCLVESVVLIVWWFLQVRGEGWRTTLDPLATFSIGTVLLQWGIILLLFRLGNRWLADRVTADAPATDEARAAD